MTSCFAEMLNSLSPCIEQCLPRELLLAIALSPWHCHEDGKAFHNTLLTALEESIGQFNIDAFTWPFEKEDTNPIWKVEVKEARSDKYWLSKGMTDLLI
jgi:hypothetical protein